jgi:hypothetical protein
VKSMTLKFEHRDYLWTIRSGFPPMGSTEVQEPTFTEALRTGVPSLQRSSGHELASWVVARLNYITAGALPIEGEVFAHDTNEFGYKIKLVDAQKSTVAHGAVVFHADMTYFASVKLGIGDFQAVFIDLLTESPDAMEACEIRVQVPETRTYRIYGWDGYSLLS